MFKSNYLKSFFSLCLFFIGFTAFAQTTIDNVGSSIEINSNINADVSDLLKVVRNVGSFDSQMEIGNNGVLNLARGSNTGVGMNLSTQPLFDGVSGPGGGLFIKFSPLQTEQMRIQTNGFIGMNTPAPTERLHVNLGSGETVRFQNLPAGDGNFVVIDANGNLARCNNGTCSTGARSVQNLDNEINDLKEELAVLKSQLNTLLNESGSGVQNTAVSESTKDIVFYNMPNPFAGKTTVQFDVPETIDVQDASIIVHNFKGELVKTIPVSNGQFGNVEIDGADLAAGTYVCSLIINDTPMATTRIQLVK